MSSKIKMAITIGHDETGKAIRKYFYGKTKKECKEKIDAFKLSQHKQPTPDSMQFNTWADKWLHLYKEDEVSESAYYGYSLCIDHLNDRFGQMQIHTITPAQVQHFFKSKKDLSQSMVDKLRITLNGIFETAIDNGYASINPVKNITRPKGKAPDQKEVYSLDDFHLVKEISKQSLDGLGVFLILSTGIRRGELMGLKGSDFDFKNNRLTVQRTITDSNGRVNVKNTLKNGENKRIIPLDPEDAAYLKMNILFLKNDYIFKTIHGGILSPRQWARYTLKRFYDNLEKEHPEIKRLNPHELRHTYGTMLFKSGNDPYVVQKIMGHKSMAITMGIYVHDDVSDVESRIKFIEPQKEPQKLTQITVN